MVALVTVAFDGHKPNDRLFGIEAIEAVKAGYAVPVIEKPVKETRSK